MQNGWLINVPILWSVTILFMMISMSISPVTHPSIMCSACTASFSQDGNGYIDEQELEALLRDLYQKNNKVCSEIQIMVLSLFESATPPLPKMEETQINWLLPRTPNVILLIDAWNLAFKPCGSKRMVRKCLAYHICVLQPESCPMVLFNLPMIGHQAAIY